MQHPSKKRSDIAALTEAVEKMHGAKAVFLNSQPVHEEFQGKAVWRGTVSLFDLSGHASASRCYAWSVPHEGVDRFYAVLQTPNVDTPEKAVRASIVADHRAGTNP